MAQMIPPICTAKSPGEHEMFTKLRDDALTRDWVILHSLDIARPQHNIMGEVDFAVLVPHLGILCLEVKGAKAVRQNNGQWFYGSDPEPKLSPFKQASEGMHAVKKYVTTKIPSANKFVFWSAVAFPFVALVVKSPEWHDWQVLDYSKRHLSIGAQVTAVLNNARDYLASVPSAKWFDPDQGGPTPRQCQDIAKILRPQFEAYQSPRARLDDLYTEVKHYTEEQYSILDGLEGNPRLLFHGISRHRENHDGNRERKKISSNGSASAVFMF